MGQQVENTKPSDYSPASSASWRLNSPLIYLFGGIGIMLLLIMVALLMLSCSQWWFNSEPAEGDHVTNSDQFQKAADVHVCNGGDDVVVSPKIAVIMAGEELPTYLAAPAHVPNSNISGCSV
ncbi:protein GLUTAMINE DUMPER 1-like [Bidens hawaiensis]|uniref:protein GLUTAMINE DUMPER 1-like n=1 Tax=Bidens hawaiensis TaxID=980011 RepID=UPI00404906C2